MSQYIHSNICNFVQLLHLFSLALWSTETQKVTKAVQTDVCQIVILHLSIIWQFLKKCTTSGGRKLLPTHSLEWKIQKMFSHYLPSDQEKSCQWICVLIMHIMSKTIDQRSWEGTKTWQGGTVSHYYILVIRKFIDFISLFQHSVWFSFSLKQFPSAEFGICNI